MGARDVKANIQHATLAAEAQVTANVSVAGTEVADFDGACFVVDVTTFTAADLQVTFQESDNNSAWSDIADSDLDGSTNDMAISATGTTYINYRGDYKYIGAKITDTGTGDAVLGIYVVKGFPKAIPAS